MSTIVYGASDDLIEVEGHLNEEFAGDDEPRYLGFSNGVLLKVTLDDEGIWRIAPRACADKVTITFARGEDAERDADGCPGYSDKAWIDDDCSWVVCSTEKAVQ